MIHLEQISKIYKLYQNPWERVKEGLNIFGKQYHKEFYALDNVSVDIEKGEKLGIIGKNGSGKSTLLKIICGILNPTSGNIQVNGKISALLELGAGFNPEMTGIENIYLNGTILGISHKEMDAKLDRIVAFADIGDFIHQPVKTYSSGMFVRLGFAVAVEVEPEILIVDEALAVGDVYFQNKCYKKMRQMTKDGTTMLFVSHAMDSIRQMCDRVIWLDNGVVKMVGDVDDVCFAYNNHMLQERNSNMEVQHSENKHVIQDGIYQKYTFPKLLNISSTALMSDEIRVKTVFIKDERDQLTLDLQTNQHYTFHVLFESSINFDDLILGIILENNKGLQIFNINSYMQGKKTFQADHNHYTEVVFDVLLPKLMQGEYLVTTAIAHGTQDNSVSKTWLDHVLKINIRDKGYNWSIVEPAYSTHVKQYDKNSVEFLQTN